MVRTQKNIWLKICVLRLFVEQVIVSPKEVLLFFQMMAGTACSMLYLR